MKLAKHDLVAALSLRYDHYSAQGLFEAACKRADLADQDHYTAADVAAFRAALAKLGDRLQRVDERLDSLLGGSEAPPTTEPTLATATPAPATTPAPASPANVPQAAAPMPAVTETPKAEPVQPAQPAQAPQNVAPMPAEPAPAAVTETLKTATRIVLAGIDLAPGERLFVCGDRPELGGWDPERARPLHRDGDAWSTSIEQGDGTFKFLRRGSDGRITWEGGENREIGTAVQIETSWQS